MVALRSLIISLLAVISTAHQEQSEYPELSIGKPLDASTAHMTVKELSNLDEDVIRKLSIEAEDFSLALLRLISTMSRKDNSNFMISPLSIWSLLYLVYEGADGFTYQQMRQALRIDVDDKKLRDVHRVWRSQLNVKNSAIELVSLNAVYTDKNATIKSSYQDVVKDYKVLAVDFHSPEAVLRINQDINQNTRGLIPNAVNEQNIYGAKMFLLTSLFFKGNWKFPFDVSLTHLEPFYNEDGEVIARIPMMVQTANFVYASNIQGLDAFVLELPYGNYDHHSMIVLLPRKGIRLASVTNNLMTIGLSFILEQLRSKVKSSELNPAEVVMPKFTITTNVELKDVLINMGIRDLFDERRANLSRMGNDLFAKTCFHSTRIIVDEKGTAAAALTVATLINKAVPPKLVINKPFQYLIVEKSSNLLLFAGEVRNPMES